MINAILRFFSSADYRTGRSYDREFDDKGSLSVREHELITIAICRYEGIRFDVQFFGVADRPLPARTSSRNILISLLGTAKPIPWARATTAVLMPMQAPVSVIKGPPDEPGLIAVSV